MENSIQIFSSPEFGEIKTVKLENGTVMFKANDVANALGYSQPAVAICKLCKRVTVLETPSAKGLQPTKFISESDIYRLVMRSKLPNAERFQDWVCDEVLPQIRKTGGYIPVSREDDEKTILCKALHIMQNTVALRDREIAEKKQKIAELAPLADYADQVLLSPKCYTMTEIAKFEGMTVQNLQHLLHELRIIYRSPSGPFMLYADHLGKGYEAYRTRKGCDLFGNVLYTNTYLVWTELGRKFIHDYLKCPFVNEIA